MRNRKTNESGRITSNVGRQKVHVDAIRRSTGTLRNDLLRFWVRRRSTHVGFASSRSDIPASRGIDSGKNIANLEFPPGIH